MARRALFSLASATLTGFLLLCATWRGLQSAAIATANRPAIVAAQPGDVVINEVAWMGTAAYYTDEWIELYNTTAASIALAEWSLSATDGTPSIALDGIIPANGFYLLERSYDDDDLTVSDIPADRFYTGALENDPSAETLELRDDNGTLIDAVNSNGGPWPAGDNDTKQTMERMDPLAGGGDENWAENDGLVRNGHDAGGNPINGTPKARNSAYITHPLPEADLAVTKSGPIAALAGGVITYTIRLSNTGSLAAHAVRLTDSLPAGVVFVAQSSALDFRRDGRLLLWSAGDLPAGTELPAITVTGHISGASPGVISNVVTATTHTTETVLENNSATWGTVIGGGLAGPTLLIAALLYDGYQRDDPDEAVQLVNVGDAPADLSGWKVCDGTDGRSCAAIVSGTLGVHEVAWLAHGAGDFYTSSGFLPAYAMKGLRPGVAALSGSWPGYNNLGGEAVLFDSDGNSVDTLVYASGDTLALGWQGPAVEPWSGSAHFGLQGQMLYRRLDEGTGLPVPDTDTAGDWAQYAGDPTAGRRVRYPGWDLQTFFHPLTVTESAHVTVGVAPDNAVDVVLAAIEAAQSRIEIGMYTLRHPTIIQALVDKASAGVSVTLLLEGDPAALSKTDPRWLQQMWACQQLHATEHGVCWFMINDGQARIFDRYRYMHAKYLLIDREQALISTQNLSARALPADDRANGTCGSRGVVLLTDAPSVVARVAEVFDHDLDAAHHVDLLRWSPASSEYGPPPIAFTPVLSVTDYTTYTVVLSEALALQGTFAFELFTAPEAALRQSDALLGLLARAGEGGGVYVEALDERAHWGEDPDDDPSLRMEAFIAAARRGARVRILLNGGPFEAGYSENSENVAAAAYANALAYQESLDLKAVTGNPTQFGIHSKAVLVWLEGEGGYAHVGSLNGSETASKVNRELAIQIQSDEVYAYLKRIFDWDWYTSNPLYVPLVMRISSLPEPPVDHLVISEVLYDPSGAGEGDEWVEIYNPTAQAVDLSGWHLGDVGPAGEYGSGLYTFPAGSVLPVDGVILIARQAADVLWFTPHFEFLVDPKRDDPGVPNMVPAGKWEGFGFALGNAGDEVILLDATASPVDVLVYGTGRYPGVIAHPGVSASGHSLERRPAIYDTDDCGHDFFDRFPPDPGGVSLE